MKKTGAFLLAILVVVGTVVYGLCSGRATMAPAQDLSVHASVERADSTQVAQALIATPLLPEIATLAVGQPPSTTDSLKITTITDGSVQWPVDEVSQPIKLISNTIAVTVSGFLQEHTITLLDNQNEIAPTKTPVISGNEWTATVVLTRDPREHRIIAV